MTFDMICATVIQSFFNPFDQNQMDAYRIHPDFIKKLPQDPSIFDRLDTNEQQTLDF